MMPELEGLIAKLMQVTRERDEAIAALEALRREVLRAWRKSRQGLGSKSEPEERA